MDNNEMISAEPVEKKRILALSCEIDDVINYAVLHNGGRVIRSICIKNISEEDVSGLRLMITADHGMILPYEMGIDTIRPGEELSLKDVRLSVDTDKLVSLTERMTVTLYVKLVLDGREWVSEPKEIAVLAYDEWPGLLYTPELLTAFSMPNHPVVAALLQSASQYLEKWTGNPSLEGYQSGDPNRIKMMAAAVYAAIQEKNIVYAVPPSGFEEVGQRIRLPDVLLDQRMGTCLDLTLLYVACLEAMGLNPVMVLLHGHIFVGVWLMDQSFSNMIMDDPTQLEKRMSRGIYEMMVVECTAMCAGRNVSFDEAVASAENTLARYDMFESVIDVARARSMGIRPLPVRVLTENGYEVARRDRSSDEVTDAPTEIGITYDLNRTFVAEEATKQLQWERKLLDLSLRNMLINMRLTRTVVPLITADVSKLEDHLSDGEEFKVLAKPDTVTFNMEELTVEDLAKPGDLTDYLELESKHKKLHSIYTEKELNSCLTKLYRSAKTSMEENGASTLYLAVGLLRWYEDKKCTTPRYAPIVLLPVEIERKSASKGYSMRMRDEDAQINITLLEFLKQCYETQIPGINPPPCDEHGLDIPQIFALVRHAVMNLPGWDVIEVGFLGNFSFSQFVLWNDVHNNAGFLENNHIVRSLINGAVDWDCSIPEGLDTEEAYLPITADASQLKAINMASAGVSFVLHGPPGTGKSQTITAMIANALTKGKTVLFVAEKMAALEVVQKRLAGLGIEDFCLELHSNKATKKAVLDQLRTGLELTESGVKTDYENKIRDIRKMRADLDDYARALHADRPFGRTLRQLMDLYETVPEYGVDLRFDTAFAGNLTERDLLEQEHSLAQMVAAGRALGHPAGHPLSAVTRTEYSQSLKFDLPGIMAAYKEALIRLDEDAETLINSFGTDDLATESKPETSDIPAVLGRPVTEEEWRSLYKLARSLVSCGDIPTFLRKAENVDREFDTAEIYLTEKQGFDRKQENFLARWNENILRMDLAGLRARYDQANGKFLGKGKALAAVTAEIQAYSMVPVVTDQIPVLLNNVGFYLQDKKAFEELSGRLPYEWKQLLGTYDEIEKLKEYKAFVQNIRTTLAPYETLLEGLDETQMHHCVASAKALVADYESVISERQKADAMLELDGGAGSAAEDADWLAEALRLCDCIIDNNAAIKDWIVYRQFADACHEQGLSLIVDAYESGMEHDILPDVYRRCIYRAIILSVIRQEPVLNSFTGIAFNERIAQFKRLDEEFMELTKEEMYYQLTHQLPDSMESVEISKELNILRRAITSNGRGISIRSLFEQIPHVMKRLCPCMLMSPISVAQYLEPANDLYDIVIFDEASQLPTCKAVGVLARGTNAVIVGDPNQMPPTSFFAGNVIDEDNLDIEDLDSILDDCLALGMPQTHLRWHYRSRHESLIAFSNQEFYENAMYTFPSVNDREKRVSFRKVDGFFDRGKTRVNRAEAEAIVAEIQRRYKDPVHTDESIGVVTFNITQQTLIEDMLQEAFIKDPAFDRWANRLEDPLFVKNLENVQGDERDVILFSVAFAPDMDGRLSLNFGPLNKDGGWKRLNVAVTRSRLEMVVFSSMTSDMIDLKRTKAKGVEALRDFLAFAEKGRLQGDYIDTNVSKDRGIEQIITTKLTEAGYKYQCAVGHSKFRIDIAVINPYDEEEYLLGIMFDGESYRQSGNTKDREVAQRSVLTGLGWKLIRMWTMDWWDNRDKEIEKLLALLDQLKEEAKPVEAFPAEVEV